MADGRKVKAVYKTYSTGIIVPQDSVYHGNASYDVSTDEWDGHYMYRSWYGHSLRMFMVQTPEGYVGIDSHRDYAYYYYVHDHLGNVRITRNSPEYYADQSLEYYPSGVLFDRSTEKERQPYMFGGKELVSMHGLNKYDFTGRWQDPVIPSFTSIDPLCELSYSISPYVYCKNDPINRIDPTGAKDTTFVAGKDKPITEQPNTDTPILNPDGTPNINAYNCHSFAWEDSRGDPEDLRNSNLVEYGITKWDNNPDNNMDGYVQLDFNEPNKKGDRVIYYVDSNANGRYDIGEDIEHSAIVQIVDQNGNTSVVIGKMGQAGISENHPIAPGYYSANADGIYTSRAYFRNKSSSKSMQIKPRIKTIAIASKSYIAVRNATYVSPKTLLPIIKR